MKKIKTNEIMQISKPEKFMQQIRTEMQNDYEQSVRNKVKELIKQINMTKILLKKQEDELRLMMEGKKEIKSKEEYLFE